MMKIELRTARSIAIRSLHGCKVACCAIIACATVYPGSGVARFAPNTSSPAAIMGWTPTQRIVAFRNIDHIFPTAVVARGRNIHPLITAKQSLSLRYTEKGKLMDADAFMTANKMAGLLVIHDGKIVLEKYRLGLTRSGRWTSFSVAKSVTSTLVGAALRDGAISSLDDPVTHYIPELRGGVYDGVSVQQLLTMTSGVRWNEDYENPQADFVHVYDTDMITLMKGRSRQWPAGSHFNYSTADTDLIGVVIERATGKSLPRYLSEKIWAPYGMEQNAAWLMVDRRATGGVNISMTLRDYGRFGEFIRGGGIINGKPVLADGWVADATHRHIASDWDDIGYGYQWWVNPDGAFRALGIFGQLIYIDTVHKLVIAGVSAWPYPDRDESYVRENAFIAAVERQF